jgi:hypothetical protein
MDCLGVPLDLENILLIWESCITNLFKLSDVLMLALGCFIFGTTLTILVFNSGREESSSSHEESSSNPEKSSSNPGKSSIMDEYNAPFDTSDWVPNPHYRIVPSKNDAPRDDHIHGLPQLPIHYTTLNGIPVFRQLEPKPIGIGPPRFEGHQQYIDKYGHMFEKPS